MKRGTAMLLILVLTMVSMNAFSVESVQGGMELMSNSETEVVYGDLTGNGRVELADAKTALRAALRITVLSEKQYAAADVDGEEGVGLRDAQYILKYALRIIHVFPIQSLQQPPEPTQNPPSIEEENNMLNMEIVVGDKIFSATLYDNEAAKGFREQLPMTVNMNELNGNEKYYYLPGSLPTNSGRPSGIHTGDLMLYGNNCLVLFYESFSTSYSYTPLGCVDNPEGLAAALGSGSVQVTFRMK